MRTNRFGQAAVLSSIQLDQLSLPWLQNTIKSGKVCRQTGCRFRSENSSPGHQLCPTSHSRRPSQKPSSRARPFRKSQKLREVLAERRHEWALLSGRQPVDGDYVFCGRFSDTCLSSRAFMDALNAASSKCGLGASSHSFRRSALTSAHNAGAPLSHLMALSGHESMSALQRYLHISEAEKDRAEMSLA